MVELGEDGIALLETLGTQIKFANGNHYYNLPFWFKRVGKRVFVEYNNNKLPKELSDLIITKKDEKWS